MKRYILIVLALSLLSGNPAAGQEALILSEAAGDTVLSPAQPTLLEQLENLQRSGQWTMVTTSWGERIVCQIISAKSGDEILITYPQGNQRYLHLSHIVSVKPVVSPSPGTLKPPTLSYRGYSFPATGARVRVSVRQQGRQTGTFLNNFS